MNAEEALIAFLSSVLLKSKKDRYIGFVSKRKTQRKFLSTIYHELENCLDDAKKVSEFNKSILEIPGYKFEPPRMFGEPISSLSVVCNSTDESFLVISTDGKYGIHGPETMIDSRAFYFAG